MTPLPCIVTGGWLDEQKFPPIRWAVPGLIPEGLTVLVGPPKLGKSWLVLGLGLALAGGGKALNAIPTGRPRPVLYLALEDGHRRLQSRARHLLGDGQPIPELIEFCTAGTPLALRDVMQDWLAQHAGKAPLLVVDTLARLRPAERPGESAYTADYRFVGALKELVDAVPGAALVLVHHTRKMLPAEGADFIDAVSGTQGIAGAADATLVLSRPRRSEGAVICVTGRDVPEGEYAATCSEGRWVLDGADLAESARVAVERRQAGNLGDRSAAVLGYVNAHPAGVTATDVDKALGTDDARTQLSRLFEAGRVCRPSRGRYTPVATVASVADDE